MPDNTPTDRRRFRVSTHWSAPPALLLFWAVLALVTNRFLKLSGAAAAAVAALVTAGHIISEVWHQLGHAVAGALTGHPMRGVRFWWIFIASVYPRDEPPLPAAIHIRRALGGPIASAILTLILGVIARAVRPPRARRILWVLCLENLFVFTLQVFVPLGFNDGATIREWRRKREQ